MQTSTRHVCSIVKKNVKIVLYKIHTNHMMLRKTRTNVIFMAEEKINKKNNRINLLKSIAVNVFPRNPKSIWSKLPLIVRQTCYCPNNVNTKNYDGGFRNSFKNNGFLDTSTQNCTLQKLIFKSTNFSDIIVLANNIN